jgi:type IV pilus assembly protein PilE
MLLHRTAHKGMTLLELMIVVAIVGILASIALPSFNDSVMKARRADARNALFDVQLLQAEFFANVFTYGTLADIGAGDESKNGYYSLVVKGTPDSTGFEVRAEPVQGKSQANDTSCASTSGAHRAFCVNQDGPAYDGVCAPKTCW